MGSERSDFTQADYESLRAWILRLPSVTEAPHRFGGLEFQVHGLEFMHFHGQRHLDIRLSKEDQTRMLNEGKASRHLHAPQAGWVTLRIRSRDGVEIARVIIGLAYENSRSIMELHEKRNPVRARKDSTRKAP